MTLFDTYDVLLKTERITLMKQIERTQKLAELISKRITNELSASEQNEVNQLKENLGVDVDRYQEPNFINKFNISNDHEDAKKAYEKLFQTIKNRKIAYRAGYPSFFFCHVHPLIK